MPSVLERSALEQSPLADLHLLANELGVDGFRRLRKPDLVDAILVRQGGEEALAAVAEASEEAVVEAPVAVAGDEEPKRGRRGRRGGRGRRMRDEDSALVDSDVDAPLEAVTEATGDAAEPQASERHYGDERIVTGIVELLANGSGFLRLSPPDSTDDDVYVSAAQVKRCELVTGDRVAGPLRAPRRSERFPSLIRVDTINGRPASEVAEGTRFEDLAVAWPSERIVLSSDDVTVRTIEALTPFGKGSRVVLTGPARAGKSEALARIAAALAGVEGLEVSAVLTGVRPEEGADWQAGPVVPGAVLTSGAAVDSQIQAVEQALEHGRRVAARGGDAVVLVDGLAYLPESAARRALAAARKLRDGGSLTVIATAPAPVGGETTVVALDATATALGAFPAISLAQSGTLRPELLVGEAGAAAIRAARAGGTPEVDAAVTALAAAVEAAAAEAAAKAEREAAEAVAKAEADAKAEAEAKAAAEAVAKAEAEAAAEAAAAEAAAKAEAEARAAAEAAAAAELAAADAAAKAAAEQAAAEATERAAAEASAAAAAEAEAKAAADAAAAKPARKRATRRRVAKPTAEEAVVEAPAAAEPETKASDEEPAKPPRKRATRRRVAKPTAEEAVVEAPAAAEPAAPAADETPAKPARKRATPRRAAKATTTDAAAAEPAPAAKKPATRRRAAKKPTTES